MAVGDVQLAKVTPKLIRDAMEAAVEVTVFDGADMVATIVPASAVAAGRQDYLLQYPHDPKECLNTCWRHPAPQLEAVTA